MIKNKLEILEYLESKEDKDIFDISKKQEKGIRTLAQVRYYRSVLVDIIGKHHGMSPIDTNEALKTTFGVKTFTDLSTGEFKFLIESIIDMWKNKYEVVIPLPCNSEDKKSLYNSLGF